jgi:hypothetical protein
MVAHKASRGTSKVQVTVAPLFLPGVHKTDLGVCVILSSFFVPALETFRYLGTKYGCLVIKTLFFEQIALELQVFNKFREEVIHVFFLVKRKLLFW